MHVTGSTELRLQGSPSILESAFHNGHLESALVLQTQAFSSGAGPLMAPLLRATFVVVALVAWLFVGNFPKRFWCVYLAFPSSGCSLRRDSATFCCRALCMQDLLCCR